MENTNPENKSLDELQEIAEIKNLKVLLVQDPDMNSLHIRNLIESKKMMVVLVKDLLPEDQEKLKIEHDSIPSVPLKTFKFKEHSLACVDPFYFDEKKMNKHYSGFKRKKLKGYQKSKKK